MTLATLKNEINQIIYNRGNFRSDETVIQGSDQYFDYWKQQLNWLFRDWHNNNINTMNNPSAFENAEYLSIITHLLESNFINQNQMKKIIQALRDFERFYLHKYDSRIKLYFF